MKKALLINIPITEVLYPSASLAAISPVFQKNHVHVTIIDLNLDLHDKLENQMLEEIYRWCELSQPLTSVTEMFLYSWLDNTIQNWKNQNFNYIALSVFTYHSIVFAKMVLNLIKKNLENVHVIVGGSGVSSNLKDITDHMSFGEQILKNNWARHVVFGEGECALDALLNDRSYPGINKNDFVQVEDLNQLLPPDYSNFQFDRYRDNRLLITGSRGCVRQCTFCDIGLTWPKFRYRSPQSQVQEIINHVKKYNVTKFEFTDSLINGSVSGWIKFNELLADVKQRDPDLKNVSYSGQFICRDKASQPAIMYELMHHAGARQISVGIESFSEKLRNAMKKKFDNQAIDYHLEQCGRWAIPNIFLMLVGHPDETIQDHQNNIDALYTYKKYSDMGIIFMIRWGTTMHILKDTPLYKSSLYEIVSHDDKNADSLYNWTNSGNPNLTLPERVRRRLELHCLSYELGYSQPNARAELTTLSNLLDKYHPVKQNKILRIAKLS